MHKDAALDATELAECLVTDASPWLRKSFPALEAGKADGDCLNPPLAAFILVDGIDGLLILRNLHLLFQVEEVFLGDSRCSDFVRPGSRVANSEVLTFQFAEDEKKRILPLGSLPEMLFLALRASTTT